ncbi:MAG TPA: rhodanese-like domain-containing protein [Desulfuromonadaceae bacterium]
MKKLLLILLVVMLEVLQGVSSFAATKDISSAEAKSLLDKKKNMYVLDVRTPQEFSQARLAGAVLIPVNELEHRLGEIPKERAILVYCTVGARSKPAADLLSQRGYKEVYHMSDGLIGWYRNGFSIQR